MENITIYIALYGAGLSTIIFLWNIYLAMKDKASLKISTINGCLINNRKVNNKADFIIEIINHGRRNAMIDEVGFINSNGKKIIVSIDKHKLEETEKYNYVIEQDFLKENCNLKYVYCKNSLGKIVKSKIERYK
jgi:hypothetical protein